jgi:hypothetical protein
MTDDPELRAIARGVIDANRYMTLGTADESGLPWVSPVWYASADYREFFWASNPQAAHSRNIAVRPQVGIVIFDSQVPSGIGQGVYMSAVAEQVTGAGLERGIDVFSLESLAQGTRAWAVDAQGGIAPVVEETEDVPSASRLRLYRATATEQFILDPDATVDRRRPVSI